MFVGLTPDVCRSVHLALVVSSRDFEVLFLACAVKSQYDPVAEQAGKPMAANDRNGLLAPDSKGAVSF